MTQQVIYDAAGLVLQWQDTDKFSYADPEDGVSVIKVTPEQWANQSSLKWVRNGKLTDIAPVDEMTETEKLADAARSKRNQLIKSVRWRIERHRDEVDLGLEPTEPLEPLLQHVQDLRDVTSQKGFPDEIDWPVKPLVGGGDDVD